MRSLRLVESEYIQEDEDIKALSKSDPTAAFDAVVRKYREPLFHHAACILKDYEEGIDVVQEVFIKALRERRFYDQDFKIKAWLYRVTSNLCFNMVRDRRRRTAILDTLPKKTASDALQLEALFQGQQQQRILGALDRITGAHRQILMLRYYSDLSYAEIADVLDIKLGTVMSRLSRAKSHLMEVLGEFQVLDA